MRDLRLVAMVPWITDLDRAVRNDRTMRQTRATWLEELVTMPFTPFREFERTGWAAPGVATAYHEGFGDLTRQSVEPLLDAARVGPGTRLVDVACGPGYVTAAATQRGAEAIGIDFSPAQVAMAKLLNPGIDVREGDAMALPISGGSADAVVSGFGMPHFPEPETFLRESLRVLRPGGRVAFATWAAPPRATGFGVVLDAVSAHGTKDLALPPAPDFFRFGHPAECERAFLDAGFTDPSTSIVPQIWRLASADELIDWLMRGTVRIGALLRGQRPEALAGIRAAAREATRAYTRDGVVEFPMPAVLAAATRP
jgi:ubiquinone/menaquinone biosynthesis C-methylase UbiE